LPPENGCLRIAPGTAGTQPGSRTFTRVNPVYPGKRTRYPHHAKIDN